jgi:hypothetical protein
VDAREPGKCLDPSIIARSAPWCRAAGINFDRNAVARPYAARDVIVVSSTALHDRKRQRVPNPIPGRSLRGTIQGIDRLRQRGDIAGDDRSKVSFEREGLVRWLQFDRMQPGVRVIYELESSGAAINVELAGDDA